MEAVLCAALKVSKLNVTEQRTVFPSRWLFNCKRVLQVSYGLGATTDFAGGKLDHPAHTLLVVAINIRKHLLHLKGSRPPVMGPGGRPSTSLAPVFNCNTSSTVSGRPTTFQALNSMMR